ncbi:tetrapyrrole methylase family protein / MazG family protein [Clostridium acidisoli DSM 12555]|uniref:Tetrapyrrole methylase family protein / MazG family protein n=1 Tax=Clostridium acidisoli DSM 12555 TaxID=1121291 RepID=A0A1W1XWG2_9CLOT|nr:nucleoside triphosphate pyrophosphohydrolase [Clostridium acidisoli]SMC28330.1 tetrapyrrole methylase family protein / MazG family protein [Clostridium acidisoli DSM 12555]
MISIVGLGPGDLNALTMGTVDILRKSNKIFLRTIKHPTVKFLETENIKFETFDNAYEKSESFDDVYQLIAKDLIRASKEFGDIVYAVPGHPLVAEKSVTILLKMCKEDNIKTKILPAVSFVDSIMEALKIDPINGVKIIDAFDIKNQIMDKRTGLIITQVYNKLIASEVKLALLEYYRDDTKIYFVRAAGIEGLESIREIDLYELDRQEDIDYLTSVYVPKNLENTKDFNDLLHIMDILRGEDGCPWDREQTHDSIKRGLIEESYEVIEALEKNDDDMVVEELGDVLLQIVFHAQIGKEEGYYNINDVIKAICNKMILRHPHVFGNENVDNSKDVLDNWEKNKMKEQNLNSYTDSLKHVAKNLPALIRAEKVQKKASKVGFDFRNVEDAIAKVLEETDEVKCVYKGINKDKILEEVGDLAFSVVNIARILDIDPENALNYTIDKFIKRFEFIELKAKEQNRKLEDMSIEDMDKLWNEIKHM